MPTIETDVCIIGGGISSVLIASKLSERKPGRKIVVVEAGKRLFDAENRMNYRRRSILYGENAWPGDFIPDQGGVGVITRTMAVGGSAMHWQGHANRFSEEDLRLHSLYGLAADWPLDWSELEKYCCEAERRIGVAGTPGPHPEDKRSELYPMAAMPLT
jgi:choline dehydrogenase-like flavoprotein